MRITKETGKVWTLVLLAFPVTTFPYLPLGQTVVKPLSVFPTLLALTLLLINNNFKLKIYKETVLLNRFVLYATIASILSSTYLFGIESLQFFGRAWIALIIGWLFYTLFRIMNETETQLIKTEITLQHAMAFSVAIEILQFLISAFVPVLSFIPDTINLLFVDVAGEWTDRFHGLAYEPSWLASQLCLIVLPLSISRIMNGPSLGTYKFIGVKLKIETAHAITGVTGVILSGSRTAIFTFIAMLFVVFFSSTRQSLLKKALFTTAVSIILLVGISRVEYVSNVFDVIYNASDLLDIALRTNAAPRFSAWVSAFDVFKAYPFFGTGLGNSFHFYAANVPDWALNFSEAEAWADGISLPNPKNMPLKLLAETGAIGAAFFLHFVFVHFSTHSKNPTSPRVKTLSKLIFVALIFNYFSLDSFALPTEWFALAYLISLRRLDGYEKGLRYIN